LEKGGWAFLLGDVAAVREDGELGAGQLPCQTDALCGRYDSVIIARDYKNREIDFLEPLSKPQGMASDGQLPQSTVPVLSLERLGVALPDLGREA
jgi:hypothetical protein